MPDAAPARVPSKTAATWLALAGGALGLHHLYLGGRQRWAALLYPVPTLAGLAGVVRLRSLGVDDAAGRLLAPWLGVAITAGMLAALVIGLTPDARWARRHAAPPGWTPRDEDEAEHPPGLVHTGWGPVLGVILALMLGGGVLVSTIAFSVQQFFEP